jgi:EAL domain-containing protein (putative c-di-GMP-specific phosphodiesterase class I)
MIGLHGPHTVNAFFITEFLSHEILPGLTYGIFFRLFAVSGGSGMGLSLLIALFLNYRDFHDKYLLRMSAPFVLFNINTMLIFGLPVIFNPFLVIPFVFLPLLNISIAYTVLKLLHPVISGVPISWVTPVGLDAYLASGGNLIIVLLQLFLIGLSVVIYYPFVRKYIRSQNPESHLVNIENNLGISLSLQMKDSLVAFEAQRSIIQSSYELEKLSRYLSWENLILYYQPKVDTVSGECHSYEALLRLKQPDGKVIGPSFLEHVERAGLSAVIDFWVCQKVKSDMKAWEKEGFLPCIGINLHPDTLLDKNIMKRIIDSLKGMNVEFEIIERSLLDNEKARTILRNLQQSGFRIAIDDFGVGHSNFDTISYFNIDSVKIDKSLIDIIDNPRSLTVCKHIVQLCTELGIVCIAEGVESKNQLDLLASINVNLVQGFYISRAIPPDEVVRFNCIYNKGDSES